MYSFASSSSNPFLPDDEDNDFLASRKCRDPTCQEKALKDLPTCLSHLVAPPLSDKASSSDCSRNTSNGIGVRSLVSAVSPPQRKTLDGKSTARKSSSWEPFLPAEARLHQPLSANTRSPNGYSTNKASLTKASESSFAERHARKRQRLISPRNEDVARNPGRSASTLAMPNGVLPKIQNSKSMDTNLHPGKLPTLNADLHSLGSTTTDLDGRQRPVLSYGDYLKSPLTAGLPFSGDLPKLNADLLGSVNRSHPADSSPRSLQRNGSTDIASSQKSPPVKATPTRTKPGQNEKVAASPHSRLKAITRTPPLEKQRRSMAQEKDASSLDAFIYAQSNASQPPPGGSSIKCLEMKRQESVLYAPIDPRSHRMRPHSDAWYQQKEEEIRARGGRKANFGKATQRMKYQGSINGPQTCEAGLPDRVLKNENWVNALRWFDSQSHGGSQNNVVSNTPGKTKRTYKRRQQTSTSNSSETLIGGPTMGD